MKKIAFVIAVFLCAQAQSQTTRSYFPATLPVNFQPRTVDASQVEEVKNQLLSGRNSRAGQNILLDYEVVDNYSCSDSGGNYQHYAWQLHSNAPLDSANNFMLRWVAVSFDTLIDVSGTFFPLPIGYPYGNSRVRIDSIAVIIGHENFSGNTDSIIISILDPVPGNSSTVINGLRTNVQQSHVTNTVLHTDTILTNVSLTPGGTSLVPLVIRPNFTLPPGKKFLISVHFFGDSINEFYFYAGYCDLCGQSCVAENSIIADNTISSIFRFSNGFARVNDMFFPCGRTPPPHSAIPGNCEKWFIQNANIMAFVSLDTFYLNLSDEAFVCFGDSITLSPNVVGGTPPFTYSWSPATGLSNPNIRNPVVFTSQNIKYTLTVTDSNDVLTDSILVVVDSTNRVFGQVSSFLGQTSNTKVLLVGYDPVDSFLTALDSTFTDAFGNFSIKTQDTVAYVKIIPDSAYNPMLLPTYYNAALTFLSATPITFTSGCHIGVGIFMYGGANPGGPGFIGGYISQGAGKRNGGAVQNLELLLLDSAQEPVAHTFTNVDGYFSFSNLAHGIYHLWVDNGFVNNTTAPVFVINAGNEVQDSLQFALNRTSLELLSTGISGRNEESDFSIFPNPNSGTFSVLTNITGEQKLTVKVFNIYGKESFTQQLKSGTLHHRIDMSAMEKGMYFLRIESGKTSGVVKILIQ